MYITESLIIDTKYYYTVQRQKKTLMVHHKGLVSSSIKLQNQSANMSDLFFNIEHFILNVTQICITGKDKEGEKHTTLIH